MKNNKYREILFINRVVLKLVHAPILPIRHAVAHVLFLYYVDCIIASNGIDSMNTRSLND